MTMCWSDSVKAGVADEAEVRGEEVVEGERRRPEK